MHFVWIATALAFTLFPYIGTVSSAMMEASHVREYFYVGGEYTDSAAGHLSHSQMYVEKLSTNEGSHQPYPIIFVHSGGQSGTVTI